MPGFVVCVPSSGTPSVAPCVDDAGGASFHPVVMQLPAPGSVEFSNANQLYAYGLTIVVAFWAVGYVAGLILSLIKRGQ